MRRAMKRGQSPRAARAGDLHPRTHAGYLRKEEVGSLRPADRPVDWQAGAQEWQARGKNALR